MRGPDGCLDRRRMTTKATGALVAVALAGLAAATVLAADVPVADPPTGPPVQASGDRDATCVASTDEARTCQRDGGAVTCSNIGIAPQPAAIRCTTRQDDKQDNKQNDKKR